MPLSSGERAGPDTHGTLTQNVVSGGFWLFALQGFKQTLAFARLIVLARLLAPRDFGLLGIAMLTLMILEAISQTGFRKTLIRHQRGVEGYLDVAWTFLTLRGLALYVIVFLTAPAIARFFDVPMVVPILRALGLSLVFQSLTNIALVRMERELNFGKVFFYQVGGTAVDFAVAVVAALVLRNVWALVLGVLAGDVVRLLVSYAICPRKPGVDLDRDKAGELFRFGRWIMGSSILNFILLQGDDVLVGKLLGATTLGIYQMAYRISNLPATEITQVISRVALPAYSMLGQDVARLRSAYFRVLRVTSLFSFPAAGAVFCLAPLFTVTVLGDKWAPAILPMQVLAVWGLVRSLGACTGPLFTAVGRPDLVTKLQLLKLVLLVVSIYPMTVRWGIVGTSVAVVAVSLVANPVASYFVLSIVRSSVRDYLKILIVPFFATLTMVGASLAVAAVQPIEGGLVALLVLGAVGFGAYAAALYVADRFVGSELMATVREVLTAHRRPKVPWDADDAAGERE